MLRARDTMRMGRHPVEEEEAEGVGNKVYAYIYYIHIHTLYMHKVGRKENKVTSWDYSEVSGVF